MKSPFFILTMAAALALTSCQEDNLTDSSISPDLRATQTGIELSDGESDVVRFNFLEQVFISPTMVKAESRSLDRFEQQPGWSLKGFGDSEILNIGSWYIEIDLFYNPGADAISGRIKMTFPDYGDEVTFVAYGGPALVISKDGADQLTMQLAILKGTGRFAEAKFEGSAAIDLVKPLQNDIRIVTNISIQGDLIKDNR